MQALLVLMTLTGLHGLFVLAEYALVKTSRESHGYKRCADYSGRLTQIHHEMEEYLLVCQIGKTVILLGVGVLLGGLIVPSESEPIAVSSWTVSAQYGLVFALVLLNLLVLGYELPKRFAIAHSDTCAEGLVPHLLVSRFLLWPVLWIVIRFQPQVAAR